MKLVKISGAVIGIVTALATMFAAFSGLVSSWQQERLEASTSQAQKAATDATGMSELSFELQKEQQLRMAQAIESRLQLLEQASALRQKDIDRLWDLVTATHKSGGGTKSTGPSPSPTSPEPPKAPDIPPVQNLILQQENAPDSLREVFEMRRKK